jgi:uncharacterized protein YndB with AHSA1/START domain
MPTAEVTRRIDADQRDVWEVIADPHHLARWWPRVTRVESVSATAFTEVLVTAKGRPVRADFTVVEADPPRLARWRQELEGTPFARFLDAAETELRLEASSAEGATDVTLVVRETPHGLVTRLGAVMMRRAAQRRLSDALDGLARIVA